MVTRQGSRKGQGNTRSEMAAEERQLVITRCPFLKNRVREVNVFNVTKEGMSRCPDLPSGWQVTSKVVSSSGRRIPAYVCPRQLLAFRSKVSAYHYILWKGETSEKELAKIANRLKLRPQ